jgi:hypothetical protein
MVRRGRAGAGRGVDINQIEVGISLKNSFLSQELKLPPTLQRLALFDLLFIVVILLLIAPFTLMFFLHVIYPSYPGTDIDGGQSIQALQGVLMMGVYLGLVLLIPISILVALLRVLILLLSAIRNRRFSLLPIFYFLYSLCLFLIYSRLKLNQL